MNMKEIMVENCISPTRLDRYIKLLYPSLTQGLIEKYLRKGNIKIDNQKSKANSRVSNGNLIQISESIDIESFTREESREFSSSDISIAKKIISDYKIYEDENFIAINKPSGISSQGGEKLTMSIDRGLQYLNKDGENSYKLVHRLDRETSGLFLIAKSRDAAIALAESFKNRVIKKVYLAVLVGNLKNKIGKITAKIKKDTFNKKQIVDKSGDEAVTEYKVLTENKNFSLVLFFPKTGRMHQLRIHSAHLGNPIVGDSKYGAKGPNLYLHALSVEIPEAIFQKAIIIKAEIPDYFTRFLDKEFNFDYKSLI